MTEIRKRHMRRSPATNLEELRFEEAVLFESQGVGVDSRSLKAFLAGLKKPTRHRKRAHAIDRRRKRNFVVTLSRTDLGARVAFHLLEGQRRKLAVRALDTPRRVSFEPI